MMKRAHVLLLLIAAFAANLPALNDDIQHALAQKYEHTVLFLHQPVDGSQQHYSSAGVLLNGGHEGPWTIDAAIQVDSIQLTPEKLTIEATRQVLVFDQTQNAMVPFPLKKKHIRHVKLEIDLDAPVRSLDEAEAVIRRIFGTNQEELIDTAPAYWHSFLTKQKEKPNSASSSPSPAAENDLSKESDLLPPGKAVRIDGKTVKPPEPLFTPEPSFSREAKEAGFQGTMVVVAIVDQSGKVAQVRIARPLGMGLDEQAVETVRSWRFRPATRNGKPVMVEMGVEISFNLY